MVNPVNEIENKPSAARLALMIDLERCTGCRSCEVACKQENRLGPGEFRNKVVWSSAMKTPGLDFLAFSCQQCERPACLRACPVNPKAIAKDPVTGIVRINESLCTGCGECVIACPYSAMGYDPQGHHAVKCDLCEERRAGGEVTTACASVCPTRAISFGRRDELLNTADKSKRQLRDNDHFMQGPATIYLEHNNRPRSIFSELPTISELVRPAFLSNPVSQKAIAKTGGAFPYREERTDVLPDRVVPGGCNICFNCCSVKFHFKEDQLVKITGNDDDPLLNGRVCPKSQLTLQMYHSEHRLLYPQKRVGKRGEGKFERITWNQALDEIANRLKSIREEYGSEALAIYIGARAGLIDSRATVKMFADLWGTPHKDGTEPFCASGKNVAFELIQGSIGSGNSYTEADLGSAQLYLYIGDNQAETRPVYFGMINDWRLKNEAKMVVVDPRLTATASKADRWLSIRPGTDMALGLALAQHILANDLHDQSFCEQWVVGFQEWREFIMREGYTPEWAEPITSLPASEIRRLAEEIVDANGCVIFASRGVNQHTNSTQTNRVLMFVAAITGNWGRRGGAYFNMSAVTPISGKVPSNRIAKINKPRISHSPSGWIEAMITGKPYPIRGLITGNNPLAQWPDQTQAREAFASLDLLVHIDLFANETSAYADYLLPAASGIEKGDIGRANDDRRIVWIDKMIDPPGEAKSDTWIWIELGKRFGFDDVLKEEYKDPAVLWDQVCIDNDALRGCTQKRLHAVPYRWVRQPVASEGAPEIETLYLDESTANGQKPSRRFPTKSGKLEFWTREQEELFATIGLSALPQFYSEREQLIDLPYAELRNAGSEMGLISPFCSPATLCSSSSIVSPDGHAHPSAQLRAKGFDVELITGRPPAAHFHSWTHYFWQAQEMWPDLYCQIHPEKAQELGISDGEKVRIETSHGEIEAVAWIHSGIRRSAVFIPIGWGERQPYNPWRPVNFLTDQTQRDPISDQTNLKQLLCRVRRAH